MPADILKIAQNAVVKGLGFPHVEDGAVFVVKKINAGQARQTARLFQHFFFCQNVGDIFFHIRPCPGEKKTAIPGKNGGQLNSIVETG